NVSTLVEAARGNLDSAKAFSDSKANTNPDLAGIQPNSSYRSTYNSLALGVAHPIQDAKDAALEFCDVMNTSTKCHFGFVAFDTEVGTDANTQSPSFSRVAGHPGMGSGTFPLPLVPLDSAVGHTHYTDTQGAIRDLHPLRRTNIGLPLDKAVDQLIQNHRKD